MFDKYELYSRGILPYDGEKEARFIRRGNAVLDAAANTTDIKLAESDLDRMPYYFHHSFDYGDVMRQKALAYVRVQYNLDLTWVRFLKVSLHDINNEGKREMGGCLFGYVQRQVQVSDHIVVVIPVIFIRKFSFDVMHHELVHAGRADILENYRRFLSGDSDRDVGMYEERVANNRFYRSDFSYLFGLNRQKRNIYRARRNLEKYFGDKAGYVFIRLNYHEAMHSLWHARNPVEFIKEGSRDNSLYCQNLKFKIMADKLGL